MWAVLALGALERSINALLELDPISKMQLQRLSNKRLRVLVDSPKFKIDVVFDHEKIRLDPVAETTKPMFESRPFDQVHTEPTTTLAVENLVELVHLLLTPADQIGTLPIQGDYHLLFDLQKILKQLEPDLASRLAPWIGPVAAHELSRIDRLPAQLKRSLQSQAFFLKDFIKEDLNLFAARWQFDELNQDTRKLNQEIDRLQARIERLDATHSILK